MQLFVRSAKSQPTDSLQSQHLTTVRTAAREWMVKKMGNNPKGCFYCQYFYINPPIIREPYTCLKGAKQMPGLWMREEKVADDCPIYGARMDGGKDD